MTRTPSLLLRVNYAQNFVMPQNLPTMPALCWMLWSTYCAGIYVLCPGSILPAIHESVHCSKLSNSMSKQG